MLKNNPTCRSLILLGLLSSHLYSNNIGSLLFHGNCITCHHETKALSAPSVVEFRESYLRAFPEKKDFVKHMSIWVVHPDKETSIMLDAIKKYSLMPELGFERSTIEIISEYIYSTDFTKEHEGHDY